ncbi:MAG: hypothetical protein Q8M08_02135, partial [Bacteroidales bacterium]|nr:hypothetical protein [Bacteroidales bacterium]
SITYPAFFGLVAVTGLRISEAISLNDRDVDLQNGIISVTYNSLFNYFFLITGTRVYNQKTPSDKNLRDIV